MQSGPANIHPVHGEEPAIDRRGGELWRVGGEASPTALGSTSGAEMGTPRSRAGVLVEGGNRVSAESSVWYVAYGSNMDPDRLAEYLKERSGARRRATPNVWVPLEREVYFAGTSRHWNGAVAFLSANRNSAIQSFGRAYLVSFDELRTIFRYENGYASLPWSTGQLPESPGALAALPFALSPDGFRGKYNLVIRLADFEGKPAYTLTTAHLLKLGIPSAKYCATMESGMADGPKQVRRWRTITPESADNNVFLRSEDDVIFSWTGEVRVKDSSGYPAIRLPAWLSGTKTIASKRIGVVHYSGNAARIWVVFDEELSGLPVITPSAARRLGIEVGTGEYSVTLTTSLPVHPERLAGTANDIPLTDVVQVGSGLQGRLGSWALAIAAHVSGPVRIVGRDGIPPDAIRVAYATRAVLGLRCAGDDLGLTPIGEFRAPGGSQGRPARGCRRLLGWLRHVTERVGESVLGAPVVALRATEGLVGDDGRLVVRVDSTVLDYLGISAGGHAVLTWADRRIVVRVLLQTPETALWMDRQLRESTGLQARDATPAAESRFAVPSHLRVWVSSTIRHRVEFPEDTVVRLRRSLPQLMKRNLSLVSLSFAGLMIAVLAIPNVPWWFWIVVSGGVFAFSMWPIRLK